MNTIHFTTALWGKKENTGLLGSFAEELKRVQKSETSEVMQKISSFTAMRLQELLALNTLLWLLWRKMVSSVFFTLKSSNQQKNTQTTFCGLSLDQQDFLGNYISCSNSWVSYKSTEWTINLVCHFQGFSTFDENTILRSNSCAHHHSCGGSQA